MALFGGNMISVTTPDGRQVTMPADLAASFPALQPVAPPVPPTVAQPLEIPSAPQPQPFTPQDQADLAAMQPPVQPPVQSVTQPQPQPAPQPRGPVTRPSAATDAGAPNTPQPVTEAQLAKMGASGAANRELQAADEQSAAVKRQGEALANQATAVGDAMAAADQHAEQLLQKRQQEAEQWQQQLQAKTDEYFRNAKAIADTKVDRSVEHPVLAAIGVVLRGIGGAMQGKDGTDVMDPLYKAIDRKVAAQMQDLDKRRGDLGIQRDALGMQRQQGMDRLQELNTYRLAYLEQAKRQIQTIEKQTSSDVIRANSQIAQANIARDQAGIVGTAQQRWQAQKNAEDARAQSAAQHAQSIALTRRGQDMQQRESDLNREERRQEKADAIAAQLLASGQKAAAERVKQNAEQGIGDPTSGEFLVQPEQQKLASEITKNEADAKKFSEAAASEKDASKKEDLLQRAQMASQKADQIRGEVKVWHVGSPEERKKLSTLVASSQTIASTADEIKQLRKTHGPKWLLSTEGQATMDAKGTALLMALKTAWQLGILSADDTRLLNKATGGNPSSWTAGDVFDTKVLGDLIEGPGARLDSLVSNIEMSTRTELRSRGFRGEYRLKRDTTAQPSDVQDAAVKTLRGDTPVEAEAGTKRGVVGRAVEGALQPFGEKPADRRARNAAESSSTKFPGLSDSQATAADLQLKAYRQGTQSEDPKSKARAEEAGGLLVSLATDPQRPALRNAMLTTLQTQAPDLYERALAKLPKEDQETRAAAAQGVTQATSASLLRESARWGDEAARKELARRAGNGDKDAIRAVRELTAR